MLEVRENEIPLRTAQMVWWYCAFAHLRGNTGHQQRCVFAKWAQKAEKLR